MDIKRHGRAGLPQTTADHALTPSIEALQTLFSSPRTPVSLVPELLTQTTCQFSNSGSTLSDELLTRGNDSPDPALHHTPKSSNHIAALFNTETWLSLI